MSEKITILCVDDEQDIVDSLFDVLMDDYNVITTTDSQEVIGLFDKHDISIIITDQRMPTITGSELLKQVHEVKPICKKILLTGYSDIDAAVMAINEGAVDRYFSKPWDEDELKDAIKSLIKSYKSDQFFLQLEEDVRHFEDKQNKTSNYILAFEAFLDTYDKGVCVVDDTGKIAFANGKALELLECKSDAVTNKQFSDIFKIEQSLTVFNKDTIVHADVCTSLQDCSLHSMESSIMVTKSPMDEKSRPCGIIFDKLKIKN